MEQLVWLQPSVRGSAADSEKGTEIKRCRASSLVSWRGSFCTRSPHEEQKIQTQPSCVITKYLPFFLKSARYRLKHCIIHGGGGVKNSGAQVEVGG